MAQDTLLGFPAHTLPYRRGKLTTLSTVSAQAFSGFGREMPALFISCGSLYAAGHWAPQIPLLSPRLLAAPLPCCRKIRKSGDIKGRHNGFQPICLPLRCIYGMLDRKLPGKSSGKKEVHL